VPCKGGAFPESAVFVTTLRDAGDQVHSDLMPLITPRQPRSLPLRILCAASPGILLLSLGMAQTDSPPAVDAAAVVRRAIANRFAEDAAHQPMRFVLHKQDERHNTTQEIVETPQGDVAMLVAANGTALSAAGQQAERTRLGTLDAHPEYQEHRRKREQEDQARVDKLMRLLPDAFLYHYESTVPCDVTTQPSVPAPGLAAQPASSGATAQCYHMTFTPNPNFDPPDIESRVFKGMAGEIWIETSAERLCRLNAHLIQDVDFGWGIVGRLDKGGTVALEQTEIGPKDWELTRMKLNMTGKALMVKPLSFRVNEEMAHFEPVPAGTDYHAAIRLLEAGPPHTP
jgi:hypothetical protein